MTDYPPPGASVRIVEVGPRDGLQNEAAVVTVDDRIAFIGRLSAAGLSAIEVAAFVSPHRVPRMGDAEAVVRGLPPHVGTTYSALVPNLEGLSRALSAGLGEVAIFPAASETFSRRNINRGIEESLAEFREVVATALAAGVRVRGYLSASFGCPYEGAVPASRVASLAERLLALGVYEVVLSDTIGIAHPGQVRAVLETVRGAVPVSMTALHFHDTRGTGLANVLMALSMGVTTFDSSAGGLGGCPFAPGAAGNLATEDLVYMLDGLGVRSGIDLARLVSASMFIESRLDHELPSKVYRAERRKPMG
jgi:hydroxymethylglutaryl-CoA lyase